MQKQVSHKRPSSKVEEKESQRNEQEGCYSAMLSPSMKCTVLPCSAACSSADKSGSDEGEDEREERTKGLRVGLVEMVKAKSEGGREVSSLPSLAARAAGGRTASSSYIIRSESERNEKKK